MGFTLQDCLAIHKGNTMNTMVNVYKKLKGYDENLELHTWYEFPDWKASTVIVDKEKRTKQTLCSAFAKSEIEAVLGLATIDWFAHTVVPEGGVK